ncbi:MAG TPA: TRAP transporter large permease subunit [Thermoanaerobaculaceae bacterium]|nr:TRAP transporter large permease subunit [Thermoanaerobaculaceae bacterium]
MRSLAARLERGALVAAFLLATLIPLANAIGRPLGGLHVPGSAIWLQQLTIWLAFLGGLYAVREGKHLTLSTAELLGAEGAGRRAAHIFSSSVAAAVVAVLAFGAFGVVMADRQGGEAFPLGLPVWVSEIVMPLALALMAARFADRASSGWRGKAVALGAVGAAFCLALLPRPAGIGFLVLEAAIVVAVLLGAPVFVAMAGSALLLFFAESTPVSAVPAEIYRLIGSPTLPAIPLLTACGYVLAESRAAHRLVRFFRALFGFMPGGIAVLVAGVCALFTTFTGGSGITIIALGGLVYPILREEGYPAGFSLGLVTAAGSLGLLFPPSLPVILYSVVANVPADLLYLAGVVPGVLLVALVAAYGIAVGKRAGSKTTPFSWREIALASWGAKWELSIPVVVVGLFASGLASLVEASAAAAAYAMVIECFITRDIHPVRDLPRVLLKGAALVGGVLILLASAMGLTSYLVDAQVPTRLLAAVQAHVHSQTAFLLVLNLFLLVLGSVLEIYSAIVILTPLVVPLGAAFGVDPVHLGVIFLANLELGFLFPPVGLNLFLSSSRFGTPMPRLYRHVVPFLLILALGVLLVTYVPAISVGVLRLFGK